MGHNSLTSSSSKYLAHKYVVVLRSGSKNNPKSRCLIHYQYCVEGMRNTGFNLKFRNITLCTREIWKKDVKSTGFLHLIVISWAEWNEFCVMMILDRNFSSKCFWCVKDKGKKRSEKDDWEKVAGRAVCI